MLHQFPKLSQHLYWEGSWHIIVLWLWEKSGSSSSRQGVCSRAKDSLTPFELHLAHLQGGDRITSSQPLLHQAAPACPWLSLPRIPGLCKALATEAWDERKRMQTSEEGERLCHKENTVNSLLIIQTPGFALSSSFTQEAQPRTTGEGRRFFPVLEAPASPALATSAHDPCLWCPREQVQVLQALSSPILKRTPSNNHSTDCAQIHPILSTHMQGVITNQHTQGHPTSAP